MRNWKASITACIAALLLAAAVANAAEEEAEKESAEESEARETAKWVSGWYETCVDAAWDDEDSDFDLLQTLKLDVAPPACDRLRFRGLLWTDADLDGDEERDSALRDLTDAYDSDIRARLLHLYAEYDNLWGDSTIRVGRQQILESVTNNRIDGIYFKQRRGSWDWYVFGGAHASLYYDTHNDLALGGGVSWKPRPRTRLALDAYYREDDRNWDNDLLDRLYDFVWGGRRIRPDLNNTLVSLSAWQGITENVHVFGRLRLMDGDVDDLLLQVSGYVPQWKLFYEFNYQGRYNRARDRVSDLSYFYRILGAYEEFNDFLVALHKPVTERITLSLEAEVRDSNDESRRTANRNYQRYALVGDIEKLVCGTDFRLAVERWNVSGDEGVWSVTGEAVKSWNNFELTVGTGYERYQDRLAKYEPWPGRINLALVSLVPGYYVAANPVVWLLDDWVVESHENIYSAYARGKLALTKNQDLRMNVTYETDDAPDSPYWRVRAQYTIRF